MAQPAKRTFQRLFAVTKQTLSDALEHASHDEARRLSSYLLDNGLDLIGKLGGFDTRNAKIILTNSPTDELLTAIDAYVERTHKPFEDVAAMLIRHLESLNTLSAHRWN
jgi:hypothetical protein